MNGLECMNSLLDPKQYKRPRKLQDVLKVWKRYQAESSFRLDNGEIVKNTAWVQDSLRDDVYM